MVWKSERWQSLVDDGGENGVTATKRPLDGPQLLEIAYSIDDGEEVQHEAVFEDPGDVQERPRLLVSLSSVTAMKELCEHEHARHDKVVETLSQCRAAYYKELRWLREQLHLAYQTDAESMAKKAKLTPDDFEVFWFEPPHYVDPETQEFLMKCIHDTNKKLLDENSQLRTQVAQHKLLLESGTAKTVLRQLRKEHTAGAILRALYALLRTQPELRDFEEVASDLLGLTPDGAEEAPSSPPSLPEASNDGAEKTPPVPSHEELELRTECQALKRKADSNEMLIAELRAKLAHGIDAKMERDRADAERERADRVQQQVARLERQYSALRRELQDSAGERTQRLKRSLHRLSEAMGCLSAPGSAACTPHSSPNPKRDSIDTSEAAERALDSTLSHLDEVAAGFETVVHGTLAELNDLRAKVAARELVGGARETVSVEVPVVQAAPIDDGRLASLEAELKKEQAEKVKFAEEAARLRTQGEDAQATITQLETKLAWFRAKLDKLKEKLRSLRGEGGVGADASDDEEEPEEVCDFRIPYTKRAAMSGKPRWQLLHEDGISRRKRELITSAGQRCKGAEPMLIKEEEVTSAFFFLNSPKRAFGEKELALFPGARPTSRALSSGKCANGTDGGARRLGAAPGPISSPQVREGRSTPPESQPTASPPQRHTCAASGASGAVSLAPGVGACGRSVFPTLLKGFPARCQSPPLSSRPKASCTVSEPAEMDDGAVAGLAPQPCQAAPSRELAGATGAPTGQPKRTLLDLSPEAGAALAAQLKPMRSSITVGVVGATTAVPKDSATVEKPPSAVSGLHDVHEVETQPCSNSAPLQLSGAPLPDTGAGDRRSSSGGSARLGKVVRSAPGKGSQSPRHAGQASPLMEQAVPLAQTCSSSEAFAATQLHDRLRAELGRSGSMWVANYRSSPKPLVNVGRSGLRHSRSAAELRPYVAGADSCEGSCASPGFLPEVMPALPAGRLRKGPLSPPWLAACHDGVRRSQ